MMSLARTSLLALAGRQYLYKLKAHANLLTTLTVVQLIALFFTLLGGTGMVNTGNGHLNITVTTFSSANFIVFTLTWAFVAAIVLTGKSALNLDFAFVSTRLSRSLANAALLLTMGALGGLVIALGGILMRVIFFISGRGADIIGADFYLPPGDLLLGTLVAALYVTLTATLGYFLGSLIQRRKILAVIVPALLVGSLMLEVRNPNIRLSLTAMKFFTAETSPGIFVLKALATSGLLLLGSVLISRRMEVRR